MKKFCVVLVLLGVAMFWTPFSAASHQTTLLSDASPALQPPSHPCPPHQPNPTVTGHMPAAAEAFLHFVDHCSHAAPPTPVNLSADVISGPAIELTWVTYQGTVDHFEVERRVANGSFIVLAASVTALPYTDSTVEDGKLYTYRVRSVATGGETSPYSNAVQTTTDGSADTAAPTIPQNLTYQVISSTQVDVSWSASTDLVGVTGYFVERCASATCADFTAIGATTSGSATTFNDTGIAADTSYQYRVRARDAAGNLSGYTASLTVDLIVPTAPTTLTISNTMSAELTLTWTASSDDAGVTGYDLERCEGTDCTNFAQIAAPTGLTYSDTGLTKATHYRYQVRAVDAAGNLSAYSNLASSTTLDDVTAPIISSVTATAITDRSATITWTTDELATSQVKYGTTTSYGSASPLDTILATNHRVTLTDLMPETTYLFQVVSTDAGDQ